MDKGKKITNNEIKDKIDAIIKYILLSKHPNSFIIKRCMKDNFKDIDDSIDYLRACVKYLIFDLEATKRERKFLENIVRENNRNE